MKPKSGGQGQRLGLLQADLGRGFIAVALYDPVVVVGPPKLQESFRGIESPHPEQVFFEEADKALGYAVAFRGPDQGRRAFDAQEGKFILKIMRHILAAMIMPQGQALGITPVRPGPGSRVFGWRARRSGSSSRPPPRYRAAVLQVLELLLEEFVIHGDFSQLLLQPGDLLIAGVPGAFFQDRLAGPRNCSRHLESRAAVTPCSRESSSRSSPRINAGRSRLPAGRKNACSLARALSGRPPGSLRWPWP
jgi:hypothetical protein